MGKKAHKARKSRDLETGRLAPLAFEISKYKYPFFIKATTVYCSQLPGI